MNNAEIHNRINDDCYVKSLLIKKYSLEIVQIPSLSPVDIGGTKDRNSKEQ